MKAVGGILLFGAWIFALINAYFPGFGKHLASVCIWIATLLLFVSFTKTSQKQITVLFLITFGIGSIVLFLGGKIEWVRLFEINIPMCVMFAAGSFLSLIKYKATNSTNLTGKKGIFSTFVAANVLGGVINLASIYIIGDRLSRNGKLNKEQVELISRGFCSAAYWSPFFVGSAVAVSLSEGMKIWITIPCGIVLTIITMLLSYSETKAMLSNNKTISDIEDFNGYSLSFKDLWLPAFLFFGVIIIHAIDSTRSILMVISMVIPITVLIFMNKLHFLRKLKTQICENFPSMGSQIALYVMAGALSTVVSGFLELQHFQLFSGMLSSFGPLEAFVALILIILISYCGLHPIIAIYTLIPMINQLNPNPTLVGLLVVIGWGLGITVSPFSATNLVFLGRYHTSSHTILQMNKFFIFKILLVCLLIFYLEEALYKFVLDYC